MTLKTRNDLKPEQRRHFYPLKEEPWETLPHPLFSQLKRIKRNYTNFKEWMTFDAEVENVVVQWIEEYYNGTLHQST
jgi:hypothetical protein